MVFIFPMSDQWYWWTRLPFSSLNQ